MKIITFKPSNPIVNQGYFSQKETKPFADILLTILRMFAETSERLLSVDGQH